MRPFVRSRPLLDKRWSVALLVSLAALGAAAACSTPPSPASTGSGSASSRSASPPPSSAGPYATISGNLHPFAKAQLDVGRRDPSLPAAGSIYFKPSAQQKAARDALVAAVQDPASPAYHHWMTPADFAARFGAQPSDVARTTKWLQDQGLTVDPPSPLAMRVGFRGTGGQVEGAFHTELHEYMLSGKKHYAMATEPQVPADIAPVVEGLRGLDDFHKRPMVRERPALPDFQDPPTGQLTLGPADLRALYDTQSLISAGKDGTGINIAIIGQTWVHPTDVAAFRTKFGITPHETDILVPGTGPQFVTQGDPGEAELDLEWSSASAPGANILYVYVGKDQPEFSVDDSVVYVVEQGTNLAPGVGNGGAQIMSESYGGCDLGETTLNADIDGEIAAAANLEGITYVTASGDNGAQGCIEFGIEGDYTGPPADMPGVTAVGGTEFCSGGTNELPISYAGCTFAASPPDALVAPYFDVTTFSAVSYPQPAGGASLESVWNDSFAFPGFQDYYSAGGGGLSIVFPKPFYQYGSTPNDGVRDVPDVSLTASPNNLGYEIYEEGAEPDGGTGLGIIGGTSAATPAFAGILAIVNQAVVAAGGPHGLGNVNPMLYAMAATSSTANAFHDIVLGNNSIPCITAAEAQEDAGITADPNCPPDGLYPGYAAIPGYDYATGLGTIDGANLVAAWTALTPTTTTLSVPSTATVGTPVTLSATVTSSSTSSTNAVGGTVSFTFETFAGSAGQGYTDSGVARADGGVTDESWLLGTVNVTSVAGSPETATAELSVAIPPGLYGKAYVVATYNGSTKYLASRSSPTASLVAVSGSNLTITPPSATLQPLGNVTLTAVGGAPPVAWTILGTDRTCDQNFECTFLESLSPTQAYVQVGGTTGGTVNILAVDTNGEEAVATLTLSGAAVDDAGTFPIVDDAGPTGGPANPILPSVDAGNFDAGPPPVFPTEDAGAPIAEDGGGPVNLSLVDAAVPVTADGGNGASGSGSSSGCSCTTAGRVNESTSGAALGGILFGLVAMRRRSRRRG
jgi:hypothetical protein